MSHADTVTREDLAIAAADVAGRDRPLPSRTPEESRSYLYATPEDAEGTFSASTLADRLNSSGLEVGVNWDKESENYGLRFTLKADRLPPEVAPFAGAEARKEWVRWKNHQSEMAARTVDAACQLRDGKSVAFSRDMDPDDLTALRRTVNRPRSSERD